MARPVPRRWPSPAPRATADGEEIFSTAKIVADRLAASAGERDRAGDFPVEEFRWLRETGLMTAALPRACGGLGLGTEGGRLHALYRVLAEIGRGSLPVGRVFEGHVNALVLIFKYGTAAQRQRAAEDAHAGHLFAVWNTEAADGVRLSPLPKGGARLLGAKTFCSGAGHVTRPFANGAWPDGGWQLALVPMEQVSTRVEPDWWQAAGMRGSVSGRVDFTDVELDPRWLIGQPGDYLREPEFNGGAVRFTAVQLGGARALFEAAVDWLQRLHRTGDPIQQIRAGECRVALETGALWLRGSAQILENDGAEADEKVNYAQMTRTAIERVCLDVLERVDRAVGARGLLPPSPVERIGRDLRLYLRQPNPDGALAAAGRFALEGSSQADFVPGVSQK